MNAVITEVYFDESYSIHRHKLISGSNGKQLLPLDSNPMYGVTFIKINVCPPREIYNMKEITEVVYALWCSEYRISPNKRTGRVSTKRGIILV